MEVCDYKVWARNYYITRNRIRLMVFKAIPAHMINMQEDAKLLDFDDFVFDAIVSTIYCE